jgi:hypothetical protein
MLKACSESFAAWEHPMKLSGELRRLSNALASVFSLYPRTDYRAAYPYRSAEERMNQAWARTSRHLNSAIEGYGQHGRRY